MAHRVHAPDGRQWTVRVRWLPQALGAGPMERAKTRLRRGWERYKTIAFVGEETIFWFWFEAFLWLLGIALVVLLVVPIIAAVIELLILLPLAAALITARLLLRHEWVVEAQSGEELHEVPARGVRPAFREARRLADQIQQHGLVA